MRSLQPLAETLFILPLNKRTWNISRIIWLVLCNQVSRCPHYTNMVLILRPFLICSDEHNSIPIAPPFDHTPLDIPTSPHYLVRIKMILFGNPCSLSIARAPLKDHPMVTFN